MKKNKNKIADDEMRPEYNLSQLKNGVRGKHFEAYRRGHTVTIHKSDGTTDVQHFKLEEGAVMLEPDVQKAFPDSESVNEALRMLMKVADRQIQKQV